MNYNKFIITADDFGFTLDTNKAIINMLNNDILTQTSLMVNQIATQDAIQLTKIYKLKCVGLHFNLTQGKSLSNNNILFNMNDYKKYSIEFIEQELQAQLNILKQNNINIHHIDTHHSVHMERQDIMNLLKKYNNKIRGDYINCIGVKKCSDDIDLLKYFYNYPLELGIHVSTSTKDLKNITHLIEERVDLYNLFLKNKDVITQLIYHKGEI